MKIRKIRNSDQAVVGIVVAVLLIGLMVSVIALIQTQYVPEWMNEKEAEHMEEVIDQFSRLKFAIDTQIATEIYTPIATTISLGSKELPFFLSQRSYGQLDIISNSGFRFQIATDVSTTPYDYDTNNILGDTTPGIGIIQYSSSNAYYIDQSFIYESGTIITNQEDGYDITIQPAITYDEIDNILTIKLVDITSVGGKIQSSGYGSTAVLTQFSKLLIDNTNPPIDENVIQIVITSNYYKKWSSFMDSLFPTTIDYTITEDAINKLVTIDFISPYTVKLEFIVYEVKAQIGPGWVQ